MKKRIEDLIVSYVEQMDRVDRKESYFRRPLVRFGDAHRPEFQKIKESFYKDHWLPEELLPEAKTLITYFMPLNPMVAESNLEGKWSSPQWIRSYGRTYDIIYNLNQKIIKLLEQEGYHGISPEDAFSCDPQTLCSRWSLRHIGYYSGLGTMGMNNVLITPAGCCGRIASVITDWDCEHDVPVENEFCLYIQNGSCGVCMERCVSGALSGEGYDPVCCNNYNESTDHFHQPHLCQYASDGDGDLLPDGSSCGKCICDLPCSYCIP